MNPCANAIASVIPSSISPVFRSISFSHSISVDITAMLRSICVSFWGSLNAVLYSAYVPSSSGNIPICAIAPIIVMSE